MIDKMYKGQEYICKIPSVLKRELLGYLEVTDREFQASWFQLTSVIINALIAAKSGMLRQQKHPYLYAGGVGELVSWRCGIGFNIKWKWFLLQSVPKTKGCNVLVSHRRMLREPQQSCGKGKNDPP